MILLGENEPLLGKPQTIRSRRSSVNSVLSCAINVTIAGIVNFYLKMTVKSLLALIGT